MRDCQNNPVTNRGLFLWCAILALMAVLSSQAFSIAKRAPSLSQVLAKKPVHARLPGPDFTLLIASLLSMSLATMSAAKGYKFFKRSRTSASVAKLAEQEAVIAFLRQHIEQLNKGRNWLQEENIGLKEKLGTLTVEIEEVSRAEKMLRKSNISLSQEGERKKAENEMLLLKISALAIKPKKRIGKINKKGKSLPSSTNTKETPFSQREKVKVMSCPSPSGRGGPLNGKRVRGLHKK
ncbi:hypothetical protein HZB07_04770 [Candidatus Saganbacteria bacterium]|nr:hypothetical protein [Candidatus Saganbacteria bacterium]